MSFFAYLLRCADGAYYAGHTDELTRRLGQHQSGECGGYTAKRLPVALVWSQEFTSREDGAGSRIADQGLEPSEEGSVDGGGLGKDFGVGEKVVCEKEWAMRLVTPFNPSIRADALLRTNGTGGGVMPLRFSRHPFPFPPFALSSPPSGRIEGQSAGKAPTP